MTHLNFPNPDAWDLHLANLDSNGFSVIKNLLSLGACSELRAHYEGDTTKFRSTIVMERYGFGKGEYKYFAYPLPDLVCELREKLFPGLSRMANIWGTRLGSQTAWPAAHADLIHDCHLAGQTRPTPLILKYQSGDHNCFHQDLYGEIHFPLQVIICLSEPDEDFTGGELVLVEQRPRRQSRPSVIPLRRGDAAIIPVKERPVPSRNSWSKHQMRHGVSEIRSGVRFTLGLIFHDAK